MVSGLFIHFLILLNFSLHSSAQLEVWKVVGELSEDLRENYIFEDKANLMADLLLANVETNKYDDLDTYQELASQLHHDLRSAVNDKHLRVRYQGSSGGSYSRLDNLPNNYGIASARMLNGVVGYIDLRGFPGPSKELRKAVADAFTKIQGSKSIVIDCRKNGGGSPAGVQLWCSYFFEEEPSIHLNTLYFRNRDRRDDFYTLKNLDGERFPDTPLYVLTSNYTFSGGEEFTYNLKHLERATIVGEVTGGGAHPVDGFELPHGIMAIIPVGMAINPITHTNWEAVGVIPHVEVDSSQALDRALEMIDKN